MTNTRKITKSPIEFTVDMSTDVWGFWDRVSSNTWETHTFEIFKQFLSKEHSYIDIGAWIGPTVLYGSQLSKKCYAFEPDPAAYAILQKNLKLNDSIKNVETFQMAIAQNTGNITMGSKSNAGDSMSSMLFNSTSSWSVPSVTLDKFFKTMKITDCNFIKMDIEGGEYLVLPHIKDLIHKVQPTFYLSLHTAWVQDKESFFKTLTDVFSVYKNIYTSTGKKMSLGSIRDLPEFSEIIATNLEWQ